MPNMDGTGPAGQGAGTGRRLGPCNNGSRQAVTDRGNGSRQGRVNGRGYGRMPARENAGAPREGRPENSEQKA